jgi:hypothetical protein
MKINKLLLTCLVIFISGSFILKAQTTFDPAVYKQFLENNKTLTASQLISDNPIKTTYYESRTHPAELINIPWFDSINRVFKLTSAEMDLVKSNFFMVSERLKAHAWANAFIEIYNNDLPLFISSDF